MRSVVTVQGQDAAEVDVDVAPMALYKSLALLFTKAQNGEMLNKRCLQVPVPTE